MTDRVAETQQDLRFYLTQEPVIVALLSLLAVALFLCVTGLSHIYSKQQQELANRWFERGIADLKAQSYQNAVSDFRTALLYSRDDYDYQLNLAEALIGQKRMDEANAYLVNLWDEEPENGLVNLELARIAAQRNQIEQALRYYHNAIYATWPGDQEVERRDTRLELVEFLLNIDEKKIDARRADAEKTDAKKIDAKAQAQSELIALAANLSEDPVQQARVADLFLRAEDYEHALAEYRLTLKTDRKNPAALAGAGLAAFELAQYQEALPYLRAAVAANPGDTQTVERLKTTELVLQLDPFRQFSASERDRSVIAAFTAAGDRLKSCFGAQNAQTESAKAMVGASDSSPSLSDQWSKMNPEVTPQGLRQDPDLVEQAMQLVFDIERQTYAACGPAEGTDLALFLIAKLHQGT